MSSLQNVPCQAVTEIVATGVGFAFGGFRPGRVLGVAAICFKLFFGDHKYPLSGCSRAYESGLEEHFAGKLLKIRAKFFEKKRNSSLKCGALYLTFIRNGVLTATPRANEEKRKSLGWGIVVIRTPPEREREQLLDERRSELIGTGEKRIARARGAADSRAVGKHPGGVRGSA
jgi:hypothetical protein